MEETREANRLFDTAGVGYAECNGLRTPELANKCWGNIAPVDVEDLALFFGDNRDNRVNFTVRSDPNPNNRIFRNRGEPVASRNSGCRVNQFNNSLTEGQRCYGCEYESRCYPGCVQNGYLQQQQQQQQRLLREQGDYMWRYDLSSKKINSTEHELSLGLGLPCTEEQWLACPATNCPVYNNVETAIAPTNWPTPTNKNSWNFYEGKLNFDPAILPACMINETLSMQNSRTIYRDCYEQWEEEQQFVEDFLSNEKRKEKSRDAARCRRSRETDIFTELAGALPITPDQAAHLDKASVMRLAIAYLKIRNVANAPEPLMNSESSLEMDALFPKALDGFMLVLSSNGDMVYLSENVTDYLGVSQMDLMGQSVYEYSHPCDHDELRKCLSMKPADVKEKHPCSIFLRLKCTLTSKGRKVNLKSASYKVIHCMGRAMGSFEAKAEQSTDEGENCRDADSRGSSSTDEKDVEFDSPSGFGYNGASLVLVGCPIPHPSNIEVPLGRQTFLSKHNLNMKFTYADDRLAEYLGWTSSEMLGKSVFEFHHALDNAALERSFNSLFSKGQCETMAYRFLGRKGGYAWVVTQATLIHCSKQHKPLSVVCVNHILSGIECEDEVYSERQLEARKTVSVNGRSVSTTEEPESEDTLYLKSLPALVFETPSPSNSEDSSDGVDETGEKNVREDRDTHDKRGIGQSVEYNKDLSIVETKTRAAERTRPLAVTASIFRSQPGVQEPRQDISPVTTQAAPKVTKTLDNRRAAWYFQDKPILEYESSRNTRPQAVTRNLFVPLVHDQDTQQAQLHEPTVTCRPPPQTTTASIFAPRTEDMNKGFLTFSEDQPGLTMLKDEPEDLTHLAPTPGDVCVPLEDTPFLSDISLDEFILGNENYCPLLSPEGLPSELPSSDLNDSLTKETPDIDESLESPLPDGDPFIYRDIPSPCSLSSDLLSPTPVVLGKSPEQNSIDSLQSSKHNDIVDGIINIGGGPTVGNPITEDEMLMLSINDVIGDEELALRAPYIPMSDQDEALQLLISDDTVMWGPTQPPDKKIKWHHETKEKPISKQYEDSSLARLLKNENRITKYNDHGGGLIEPTQIFGQISKCNNSSRLERPSKRAHGPVTSAISNESKRSRFQDNRLPLSNITGLAGSPSLPSVPKSVTKLTNSDSYDEQCIDIRGILELEEKLETAAHQVERSGSRLLLQQLMNRDYVQNSALSKTRDTSLSRSARVGCPDILSTVETDDVIRSMSVKSKLNTKPFGDGGGMEPTDPGTRGRRQSNSVLMNLLVSGCDVSAGYVCLAKPKSLPKSVIPTK